MFLMLFQWWYSTGWLHTLSNIKNKPSSVLRAFSVSILLSSLVSPWKRIISRGGNSLNDKFLAAIDNLISRLVGFFVRLFTLIIALVGALLVALIWILLSIVWPLVPILIVYSLVRIFI